MTRTVFASVHDHVHWQRISAWAILHYLVVQLKQSVSLALYFVPMFLTGLHHYLSVQLVTFLIAGFTLLLLVYGLLKYWFFQFALSESGIVVRSGVLKRTHTDLPFERIQNVRLDQPFYFRLNDIVVVTLDTAGSAKQEAILYAVTREYADTLTHMVLLARNKTTTTGQSSTEPKIETPPSSAAPTILNQRSLGDLILHGITNNRIWILLGAAAPFYEHVTQWIFSQVSAVRPYVEQWFGSEAVAYWYAGVMALFVMLGILVILALISIGGSVILFYGFTLSKRGDKYLCQSGLFSRQELSMKHSRIQIFRMQQDWLDCILRRVNLFFEQNVTGAAVQPGHRATHKLLIPSVTVDQANVLSNTIFANHQTRHISYTGAHIRYFWRLMLLNVLPICVAATGFTIALFGIAGVIAALGIACIASAIAWAKWQRQGIAHDAHYIYLRKGALGVDYWCFPRNKLQQLSVHQNLFMRKRNIVSLHWVLASGSYVMPYMPQDYAYQLADSTVAQVEQHKPNWM